MPHPENRSKPRRLLPMHAVWHWKDSGTSPGAAIHSAWCEMASTSTPKSREGYHLFLCLYLVAQSLRPSACRTRVAILASLRWSIGRTAAMDLLRSRFMSPSHGVSSLWCWKMLLAIYVTSPTTCACCIAANGYRARPKGNSRRQWSLRDISDYMRLLYSSQWIPSTPWREQPKAVIITFLLHAIFFMQQ